MRKPMLFVLGLLTLATPAAAAELKLESPWLDGGVQVVTVPDLSFEGTPELGRRRNRDQPRKQQQSQLNVGAVDGAAIGVAPQGRQMAIGLQLGSPTAVTFKYMLTGDQAIAAGLGVAIHGLSLHVDYLWHPHVLATADPFKLSWYVGLGVWLGLSPWDAFQTRADVFYTRSGYFGYGYWPFAYGGVSVAARVPIGLSLALNQLPLEFYIELDPSLLVFPAFGFGIGGTIGFRFYF